MTWILCECNKSFWGMKGKEDTCPSCLKEIINPCLNKKVRGVFKKHDPRPEYYDSRGETHL